MNVRNPKEYMEAFLVIRTKEGDLVPLVLKPAQVRLYETIKAIHQSGEPVRLLILKARQLGFSTMTEGVMFHDAATRSMVKTLIVAHRDDSTANLFKMNKLFYDRLPVALQPMRKNSNAKELVFENPTKRADEKKAMPGLMSSIRCVTAGGGGIGRSDTLTNVHLSEFAFWPGKKMETLTGIMQAVPDSPNTMVVMESTPNGYNEFKDLWDGALAGTNGWIGFFAPWHEEPTYRRKVEEDMVLTEEEVALMEAYHLDLEQIAWRRWCIKINCSGDVNTFHQEYPSCAEEAFLFSGTPFFDNEKVVLLKAKAPKPLVVGGFTYDEPAEEGGKPLNWKWRKDKHGAVKLWAKPTHGVPYVIGVDTAGDGSDSFVAYVIDNTTGKQVAEMEGETDSIGFTRSLWCLGHYYNVALMAIEVNFNTYVSTTLEVWGYQNLYVREEAVDSYTHKPLKKYGFRTDQRTRPVMLDQFKTLVAEAGDWIQSEDALEEMLHFVKNEKGRPEAEEGKHDDHVMAMAICYFCRHQQRYAVDGDAVPFGKDWTEDMWEDYHKASESEKVMLRKMWG